MCMSKGAPRKPAYGPCNESHRPTFVYPADYSAGFWQTTTTSATDATFTAAFYILYPSTDSTANTLS